MIKENSLYPKISIVTPSFNQGDFIEETILSVIGQAYPNLEYIIIDGGSTDSTVEIIKKYEKHLHYWVSEKDRGQSDAINKGFEIASGDILGWLNSDDMFLPGTFSFIANLVKNNEDGIFFGNCIHFREENEDLYSFGSNVEKAHAATSLTNVDYIIQPSSFWQKSVWNKVGKLREDMVYAFDWEWFLRAQKYGIKFTPASKALSMYRLHKNHKTATGGKKRQEEIAQVYEIYSPELAILYRKLMVEERVILAPKNNWISRLLHRPPPPESYGQILKKIKPKEYADYPAFHINQLKTML